MDVTSGSSTGHSWSDLPPELLGLVLSRLPSHADRVRIAAVCRPWRSDARLLRPLPPLLPWLALCDGTFLSLPDGAVHRLPVADVVNRVSTGSMLFVVHGDDTCSLMNPSPVRTTPLPELAVFLPRKPIVEKVVASDQLVAALVKVKTFCNNWTTTQVVTSTRGQQWDITRCSTTEWQAPEGCYTNDIALFKGNLHILTTDVEHYQPELHVLGAGGQEYTTIRGIPRVNGDYGDYDGAWYNPYSTHSYSYVRRNYLVVSDDQLLMVERRIYHPPMVPTDDSGIQEERTCLFKVFEAADLGSGCGRWTEVDTLMGRALFVSQGCSESLPAVGQCGSTGVREDCIYFMNNNGDKYTDMFKKKIHVNPFLDSGVYSMRDRTIVPLLSEMAVMPIAGDGPWSPTWLFPET